MAQSSERVSESLEEEQYSLEPTYNSLECVISDIDSYNRSTVVLEPGDSDYSGFLDEVGEDDTVVMTPGFFEESSESEIDEVSELLEEELSDFAVMESNYKGRFRVPQTFNLDDLYSAWVYDQEEKVYVVEQH